MVQYEVMLYPYKHDSKIEAQRYVGAIKNHILHYPRKLTLQQIAVAAVSGHTMLLGFAAYDASEATALHTGSRIGAGKKHWKRQQIFALDFDNKSSGNQDDGARKYAGSRYFSVNRAWQHCQIQKFPAAALYTTDSHTEVHHRFRMLFVTDRPATTLEDYQKVMYALQSMFQIDGVFLADTNCTDPCRLFYPGKTLVYLEPTNVLQLDCLLASAASCSAGSAKIQKATVAQGTHTNRMPDMLRLIQQKDIRNLRSRILKSLSYSSSLLRGEQVSPSYITEDACSPRSGEQTPSIMIRHPDDYYAFVRRFPLHHLLGMPAYTNFGCLLPDHVDNHPSARIEQTASEEYVYHCYGCGAFIDVFDVLERLCDWSHMQSKHFINQLLQISFETEWQIEKKREIADYQDYIWSNQFPISHPWLHGRLARANVLGTLNLLLQMARLYIYDRKVSGDERPLFYMSLSLLLEKGKKFGLSLSKTNLHKKIKLLTALGLIRVLPEEDIPVKFLCELKQRQREQQQHYRINCYSIPVFNMKLLDAAAAKFKAMEQIGMRREYYCREAELRANGSAAADQQYVQDHGKPRDLAIDRFYTEYKSRAKQLLQAQEWFTERQLLDTLNFSATAKKQYSGICLPQLLNELQLQRVRYSKVIEARYGISKGNFSYGLSKLIVKA